MTLRKSKGIDRMRKEKRGGREKDRYTIYEERRRNEAKRKGEGEREIVKIDLMSVIFTYISYLYKVYSFYYNFFKVLVSF